MRGFPGSEAPRGKSAGRARVLPVPARIVAIGDLHGDVRALGAILRASGLIDAGARWSGGAAHLVLLGDLVGGDRRSRLLLNDPRYGDAVLLVDTRIEEAALAPEGSLSITKVSAFRRLLRCIAALFGF